MTHTENWRSVVGYEGLYEVSDHGRVRSLPRTVQFGDRTRQIAGQILKPGHTIHGVPFVMLGRGNNRRVHLLVMEAFIGPRPPGLEACHWDDNPDNNHVDNLRWDTHSANMLDRTRNHHNGNRPGSLGGGPNSGPVRGKQKKPIHGLETHCPHGHEYTPENTKIGRNGGRFCRECHRIDGRRRHNENLEEQRAYRREQMRRWRAINQPPKPPKTHCIHGHEYTPENTRIVAKKDGRTQRVCRTCWPH